MFKKLLSNNNRCNSVFVFLAEKFLILVVDCQWCWIQSITRKKKNKNKLSHFYISIPNVRSFSAG